MGAKSVKHQADGQDDGIRRGRDLNPDCSLFLGDYITNKVKKYGDKIAQVDVKTGDSLSYAQLHSKSDKLQKALQTQEVVNESVAIVSHNCVEYVWVLLGAMKAKSCSVLLNPDYTAREIEHNFSISKPKLVICSQAVAEFKHPSGLTTAEVFASNEGVTEVWIWGSTPDILPDKCKSLETVLLTVTFTEEMDAMYSPVRDGETTIFFSPESTPGTVVGVRNAANFVSGDMDGTIVASDGLPSPVVNYTKDEFFGASSIGKECASSLADNDMEDLGASKSLVAFILSSSGSTGLPKGVMLSHWSVMAALETGGDYAKVNEISLGLLPFFHAYGLILMLMCLCEGAIVVIMPKFSIGEFFAMIRQYEIENLYLVPSLLALVAKHDGPPGGALKSVQHVWTGAAPMSRKLQAATIRRFGGATKLHHSYGLTETTFTMFSGECLAGKPGSPGKPTPGMECKVIDTKGNILGPNIAGELCFRGPLLMLGYKENPAATEEMIDQEGWLHSGDLGHYDADGYFYIVDRLKELIKYQGFQVSPSELEAILITHPAVKDVAVLGIPHEVFGELTQALIVVHEGAKVTQIELQDYLAVEVSPQKRLHGGVRFVDEIPKTPNGKILRRELKNRYANQ